MCTFCASRRTLSDGLPVCGCQIFLDKMLILNNLPKWFAFNSVRYHFGSANADSQCTEEAVPWKDFTLDSATTYLCPFHSPDGVQMTYL